MTNRTNCQNYKNKIHVVISGTEALGAYSDRAEPYGHNLQITKYLKG